MRIHSRKLLLSLLFLVCNSVLAEVPLVVSKSDLLQAENTSVRIISLAPFITELLFAIGAGDRIVGTVEFSNFPEAALNIPRVGRHNAVDIEKILSLKPDMVLAWKTGTPDALVQKIQSLGLPVYLLEPRTLTEIAENIRKLGKLTNSIHQSESVAQQYERELLQLKETYSGKVAVTVFYEIWNQPLMTVNGNHIINDAIQLCGGRNIFSSAPSLVFKVSLESVIEQNPDVILMSGDPAHKQEWMKEWDQWHMITAVKKNNLFFIHPDYIHRHTPRILKGVAEMCELLEAVRQKKN